MKQTSNSRRSRGRDNGKRQGNRNSNYDSGGPGGRIRGNASQVHEKYLTLARDALAADDRISSENYFQHAEHFYRILHANADGQKDSTKDGDTNQKARDRNRRDRNPGNGRDNNRNQQQNAGGEDKPSEETSPEEITEIQPEIADTVKIEVEAAAEPIENPGNSIEDPEPQESQEPQESEEPQEPQEPVSA